MAVLYRASSMYPPYAVLASQTTENYNVAINYYKQRKVMFQKALSSGGQNIWQEYISLLDEKAKTFNDIVLRKAMKAITDGSYTASQEDKNNGFNVYIEDIFNARYFNRSGQAGLNAYKLGFQFEKFMNDKAVSTTQLKKVQSLIETTTNNLMQSVGAVQQQAWTTGRRRVDTRTDLAISKKTIGQDSGQMELISALDLEQTPPDGMAVEDYVLDAIQQSGVDLDIFGFQLKAYKNVNDNKRWQNAQTLADRVNDLFTAASNNTWSSNYVVNYPIWYISKYLINVINPVNIGNITLNGIEYMDEWLAHTRLYMETNWERSTGRSSSAERGGGMEVIHPRVATPQILTREVGHGTYRGFVATGRMRQGAYKKEVRVASIENL